MIRLWEQYTGKEVGIAIPVVQDLWQLQSYACGTGREMKVTSRWEH